MTEEEETMEEESNRGRISLVVILWGTRGRWNYTRTD